MREKQENAFILSASPALFIFIAFIDETRQSRTCKYKNVMLNIAFNSLNELN